MLARFPRTRKVPSVELGLVGPLQLPMAALSIIRHNQVAASCRIQSQSLDAVVGYNAYDTTHCTDQNTAEAVYIEQLVYTGSPRAKTCQDRSFMTYLPKNQDGATRRTQHNNL
jgi:hypothetical protein